MDAEALIPVIFAVVMVGIFGGTIVWAIRSARRTRENMRTLARELGLSVEEKPARPIVGAPPPVLRGRFRGREVCIRTYATGGGQNRTQWVEVSASVEKQSGLKMRVSRGGLWTKLGRLFGAKRVLVGDDTFDERIYVASADGDLVRAALIPEIRERILAVFEKGARGAFIVDGGKVVYKETGSFACKRIVDVFPMATEVVCDLCEIAEVCG
ncbi:MAG: hypothetical protein D6781_13350 [Verrucomicrobia bacterium]|nr:MAG: hypothetical protein D6781_13350 [Verrucomicrobiota bacterium]